MRVAMDEQIFAVQRHGGISRMFAELAREFLTGAHDVALLPLRAPVINDYVLDDPRVCEVFDVHRARSEWEALARYFTRMRRSDTADVVHNTFYLPHGLALTRGSARVVTVHDMIPELMPRTRRRLDFLTLKRRYLEAADHVICVSEATRSDLLRVHPDLTVPLSVVHHGVDPRFTPGAAPIDDFPERYVLFVGNRSQYKDAGTLWQAFASLTDQDVRLVHVGGGSWTASERGYLDALGLGARVVQRNLPDSLMPAAYANAIAFVFPSRFEGFGLPALEAMACGTPTVLARATSLPEVGGEAAIYFEPGDVAGLTAILDTLIAEPGTRADLIAMGCARASEFTWARAAEGTAAAYRAAMAAA